MTLSILDEVAARKRRTRELRTFPGDLAEAILFELEASKRIRWPSPRYRMDPTAFCREILGVEPWEKQIEILEAVRDHSRVSVSSGHKIGKSCSAAMVALWYYCSYKDARVVMTSTTDRQVNQILWREVKMQRSRGGRCVVCKKANLPAVPCEHSTLIDGDIGELARTGFKSVDFREIVGFTAKEAEAVAGVSGENLLYIVDEASGVARAIFEAIEGNRAGGARIVLFSNPTKNEGEFFDSFHSKAQLYKTIRVSSEDTPNCKEGKNIVPGLATRAWVREKEQEWGRDSALFKVRVEGKFATKEDGKIFSVHTIEQAEQRWEETPAVGRLYLGLDPSGAGGLGDETVFCSRRGLKQLEQIPMRGLDADGILVQTLAHLQRHRIPRETPVVVFDREGSIGAELYGTFRGFLERNPDAFELVPIRASDKALRQPEVYDRQRDALAANLAAWIKDGGAIVEDAKLSAELHILEWKEQTNGRLKVTPKDVIKKALGRSPDRYDALALSVWEPLSLRQEDAAAHEEAVEFPEGGSFDPYAGSEWR